MFTTAPDSVMAVHLISHFQITNSTDLQRNMFELGLCTVALLLLSILMILFLIGTGQISKSTELTE